MILFCVRIRWVYLNIVHSEKDGPCCGSGRVCADKFEQENSNAIQIFRTGLFILALARLSAPRWFGGCPRFLSPGFLICWQSFLQED
jgi:hypothetical protein